jgi:transcriptional regulator with XRE-family HTH domain
MGLRNSKRLPSKIQELRKTKSLTQKQMAQALGLSEAMFSRIESGERAIQQNQIDIIARILEADVKELRSLSLADKIEAETHEYTEEEINHALKVINNIK